MTVGKKKMLLKLNFKFCEYVNAMLILRDVWKKIRLMFNDRSESIAKVINYYLTDTVPIFTMENFQSTSLPIEQLTLEIARML